MKLSRLEVSWARAALSAMFPGSTDTGLTGIGAMDISGYLDDVMRTRPFRAALGLRVAVWLVALAPPFVVRRFATIRGLAEADREALLDALLTSSIYGIRMLVMLLKTFGALLYASDDGVRSRLRPATPRAALVALRVKRAPSPS